jgi:hypothetical protein
MHFFPKCSHYIYHYHIILILILNNDRFEQYISEVTGLGGVTQDRMVSPKGLYSNPVNEDAIVIPLLEGSSQDIILAIQKPN